MHRSVAYKPIYDVSIVVPIYNGERYIETKLKSLTGVEGVKYEVIIALNRCTDRSEELIRVYGRGIKNLRVIRHSSFLESGKNFQSGVLAASGDYIFVSAIDDICDKEFYREAIEILKSKNSACAISPMSRYENNSHGNTPIDFELTGSTENRIETLFDNIRVSHGIFYSLIKREVAISLYRNFATDYAITGGDWLFNLKLALNGEVLRARESYCTFGVRGISKKENYLTTSGTSWTTRVFPYAILCREILKLAGGRDKSLKSLFLKIVIRLLYGNLHRYLTFLKLSMLQHELRRHL